MLESWDIPPEIYDFIRNRSKTMNSEINKKYFIDLVKYILTGMEPICGSNAFFLFRYGT